MINLTSYAKTIEDGLNALLDNANIQFVVWCDVGKYKQPLRTGNKVTTYINCLLTRSTGTVQTGGGGLTIAVDNLRLEFAVPLKEPRQQAYAETAPEVENNQFPFVEQIRNIADTYFSTNTQTPYTENGVTYGAGFQYALTDTQIVEMATSIGGYATFAASISVYVVENGINSRSVSVEIDGINAPFMTLSPSRANEMSTDVYSDGGESESIVTSTAFSLQIAQPATTDTVTEQFLDYLLDGDKNTVHFLKVTMGDKVKLYTITFGNVAASVEGSQNVGTVIPLLQVRNNPDLLNYPSYFTAATFTQTGSVTITPSVDCLLYLGGVYELSAGQSVTVNVTDDMSYYNGSENVILVYACPANTGETVTLTSNVQLTILQQGVANA